MVQTIHSITVLAGEKKVMIEKPQALRRIFFSVQVFADLTAWYEVKMSFDDPHFRSFYALDGSARYFAARGEDIFQGNIWLYNVSDTPLLCSSTEILH